LRVCENLILFYFIYYPYYRSYFFVDIVCYNYTISLFYKNLLNYPSLPENIILLLEKSNKTIVLVISPTPVVFYFCVCLWCVIFLLFLLACKK
jgi:hypothetical protein